MDAGASVENTAQQAVTHAMTTPSPAPGVHRVEVRLRDGFDDARSAALLRYGEAIGLKPASVRSSHIYLVEGTFETAAIELFASSLLANPVTEVWAQGASPVEAGACVVEVHPLPGVMDPVAQTVAAQAREMLGAAEIAVATGWRFDIAGLDADDAERLVRSAPGGLCNAVVHAVHRTPFLPGALPHGARRAPGRVEVALRELHDEALERMSRDGSLFLSLEEMQAIQAHFTQLGREPTDIELETIAQTWSEHCVHKTLKATIRYRGPKNDHIVWDGRPGVTVEPDGAMLIDNLLKRTVAAATFELIDEGVDWTLSVFEDNAGIIAFDDENAVCVKVETHNHPSAIEPYGGAATGIGGCIRDILGTGLGAKPIAATDVFCVAPPDVRDVPDGCLPPKRILTDVVAGVRDYGNRMGIPTLSGAVTFDERYVGNPLVYCGCIGVMPIDKTHGQAQAGDLIVAIGGRTGRDGIHGATFSSGELTDTHATEFSHAVQIGNAIEERKTHDALLRARDAADGPLYSAITDCGAGGFSSAVGEMGAALGADVDLAKAPLKYEGLSPSEIWISEAQERMVLAVPRASLGALQRICDEESVELCVLGTFGTAGAELILRFGALEVGRVSMRFLHEGLPGSTRQASWESAPLAGATRVAGAEDNRLDVRDTLLRLLAHPDVASKRWIIRQYDHEVQGNTVVKPLVGADGEGPGDATVIEPVAGTGRGLAIACGLQTRMGDPARMGDPYEMALAAVDECVRNLVCVGADPQRIAILDNFCWPSCEKPANLGSLVRAAVGCYDAAKAYRTPFISGKDSLNNQFRTKDGGTIEIPPTLLITGVGVVADVSRCVTMDAKQAGSALVLVTGGGGGKAGMGGSLAAAMGLCAGGAQLRIDPARGALAARGVSAAIAAGCVLAAHDCSDGGLLVAVAEMLIAAWQERDGEALGATVDVSALAQTQTEALFGEGAAMYVLEIAGEKQSEALAGVDHAVIGSVNTSGALTISGAGAEARLDVATMRNAWLGTLDW